MDSRSWGENQTQNVGKWSAESSVDPCDVVVGPARNTVDPLGVLAAYRLHKARVHAIVGMREMDSRVEDNWVGRGEDMAHGCSIASKHAYKKVKEDPNNNFRAF